MASRLRRATIIAIIAYVAFLIVLYTQQTLFIFASGRVIAPTASVEAGYQREAQEFASSNSLRYHPLRAEGRPITAFYGPALLPDGRPDPAAQTRPTLLFFYGMGDCSERNGSLVSRLRTRGVNVMLADYVGFGFSGGMPSELGCYATADAEYDDLTNRLGIPPRQIVICGRSLGTAVAIDLAARRPCAGLVTVSAFTRMQEMALLRFPIVPPPLMGVMLHHRFLSADKIKRVPCPILMIHARDDITVPFSMMGQLAQAADAPVTQIASPNGGHNGILDADHAQVLDAICGFAQTASASHGYSTASHP